MKKIACKEGTEITIKPNSFVCKDGTPVDGELSLHVREYYNSSDILLANLSTTSNGELLETGGMVNLEVFCGEKECDLKDGSTLQIAFPAKSRKPDMNIYTGQWDSNRINWTLPQAYFAFRIGGAEFDDDDVYPEFPGGDQSLKEFITNNVRYPVFAIEKGIQGTVHVGLTVRENGELEDTRVVKGVHPKLDSMALDVFKKMPKWTPGTYRGTNIPVRTYIPIKFSLGRKSRDGIANSILVDSILKWRNADIAAKVDQDIEYENMMINGVLTQNTFADVSRHVFNTSNLGWINCDRLYKEKLRRTKLFVDAGNSGLMDVKIVFQEINSILDGAYVNNKFVFSNIPVDEKIKVLGIKYENGQCYISFMETKTTPNKNLELEFRPLALSELKSEIQRLTKK